MIKRLLLLIALLVSLMFMSNAQNSEPEATVEATAEVTAEATAAPDTTPEVQATEDPECSALVSAALDLTRERCEAMGIGQACYGYTLAETESRTDEAAFNQPGDIIAFLDIQTLQLSAMDTRTGQWGVVEFKVEANLPEDPASTVQDVQFVVFGDTQLSDGGEFVKATAEETTSIYYLPEGDEIIGELETGASALASARLVGDEWVRIPAALEDGTSMLGWIPVENLTFDIDISILPELSVAEAEDTSATDLNTRFGPIQPFVFHSGTDDSPCSAAPDSGMLIQTPEGEASVTITLDEIVIQLSGTASISAQPNGDFQLDMLAGQAQVAAQGGSTTVIGGQTVSVPLGPDGTAIATPNPPEPREAGNENPLLDLLDEPVDVADPLDLPDGVPISGEWSLTYTVSVLECPNNGPDWPIAAVGTVSIEVQQDALLYAGNLHGQVGPGVYQGRYTVSNGDTYTNVLQVGATDRITGTTDIDFAQGSCTLTAPFSLQLVNAN